MPGHSNGEGGAPGEAGRGFWPHSLGVSCHCESPLRDMAGCVLHSPGRPLPAVPVDPLDPDTYCPFSPWSLPGSYRQGFLAAGMPSLTPRDLQVSVPLPRPGHSPGGSPTAHCGPLLGPGHRCTSPPCVRHVCLTPVTHAPALWPQEEGPGQLWSPVDPPPLRGAWHVAGLREYLLSSWVSGQGGLVAS